MVTLYLLYTSHEIYLLSEFLEIDKVSDSLLRNFNKSHYCKFQKIQEKLFTSDVSVHAIVTCQGYDSDYGDNVQPAVSQKHLGLVLDSKLDFNKHINNKINKCNKIIGIMKKLFLFLSQKTLLTIYKSFVRPNLDYADIIYDKPFN